MRYSECIDIHSNEPPGYKFVRPLRERGFQFEMLSTGIGSNTIRFEFQHRLGDDSVFNAVRAAMVELGIVGEPGRRIQCEPSNQEIENAKLLDLMLRPLKIRKLKRPQKCSQCALYHLPDIKSFRVRSLTSKRDIAYLDEWGWFTPIVSAKGRKVIEDEQLLGATFAPLSEDGTYFHLIPASSLGRLVFPKHELLVEHAPIPCSECGTHIRHGYIGPTRYKREAWNGDDIVSGERSDEIFYSQRAYQVLTALDKKIEVTAPVFLENAAINT